MEFIKLKVNIGRSNAWNAAPCVYKEQNAALLGGEAPSVDVSFVVSGHGGHVEAISLEMEVEMKVTRALGAGRP